MAGDPELARIDDRVRPIGLRVAIAAAPVSPGFPIDREFKDAVDDTAAALEAAGHQLGRAGGYPAYLGVGSVLTWYAAAAAEAEEHDQRALERRTRRLALAGRSAARVGLTGGRARRRWR